LGAASDFEFRFRFWIFGAIFWIAFAGYSFDHVNVVQAFLEWLARLHGVPPVDWQYHAAFGIAALVCVAAAALRTWGTAYLHPEVMVDKRLHTSRLVADGPYRYVRNPLYFGNVLLAIGFGMMASRIGFAIMVAAMIAFDYRIILREESNIAATQGEPYRRYCQLVPRLLPALRPKLPAGELVPKWTGGFLGEAFMWVLACSVIAFAITLNLKIFYLVLASAFVIYFFCYLIIKQRSGALSSQP
jgi:protein-S-isoprenylcysteine O-methyltransferase Ste14